jgi:hypothetical protein
MCSLLKPRKCAHLFGEDGGGGTTTNEPHGRRHEGERPGPVRPATASSQDGDGAVAVD